MMDRYFDTSACTVIYKSPKGVRKWFSLREYYRKDRELDMHAGDANPAEPVRLAISAAAGRWDQMRRSFATLDEAMETIEELESLGVRVEAYDTTDTSEDH